MSIRLSQESYLIAMGIEGKNVKSTLEKLLNIVIENPSLNVKEKLLKLI